MMLFLILKKIQILSKFDFEPLGMKEYNLLINSVISKEHGPVNLLWFNVILDLNFCFLKLLMGMVMYDNDMIMSLKQKKIKIKPRIKLNHNKYIQVCVFLIFSRTSLVRMQEQVPI